MGLLYSGSSVYKLMALFILTVAQNGLFVFQNSAASFDFVDDDTIPVPKHGTVSGYVFRYMAVLC